MEELQLKINQTKQNLSLLTGFFMLEEARRQPNNDDKVRELEILLEEARESCKQARRELREYHDKQTSLNNESQQKIDDLLISTKAIEKAVSKALKTGDRRQKRARREMERMSPELAVISRDLRPPGEKTPSPLQGDPREPDVRYRRSGRPWPGPPTWDPGKGAWVSDLRPQHVQSTVNGVRPYENSKIVRLHHRRLPYSPPGNDALPGELTEETQPRGPPTPPPEVRQHSPVPPSIAVQLADDLLRDQRVEEARPPGPPSRTSLEVEQPNASPPPTPLLPPPAPSRRRRPRRAAISEENGIRPADAKNYTTNTMTRNVSPPRTRSKEEEEEPQRSMRLARDQRLWESQIRGKKGKWQAQVEDAPRVRHRKRPGGGQLWRRTSH
ncbi:hypothetical protein PG988_008222 [Apiospora saccharicola]